MKIPKAFVAITILLILLAVVPKGHAAPETFTKEQLIQAYKAGYARGVKSKIEGCSIRTE